MWSALVPDGEPDDDFYRRSQAPENELPVALPLNHVLARTDDVAIALVGLQVYTTGLTFDLVVRMRPSAAGPRRRALNDLFWEHGPGRHPGFLLGVAFADGRRASNAGRGREGDELVFHSGGGSGGDTSIEQSWWLHPLPPDGPLQFAARCDELGIPETVTELDGTAIRRAAEQVVTLWPWERPPEMRDPGPPPPPDVPADSWFAGR